MSRLRSSGPRQMRTIELTQGQVALVDDDAYPILNQFKWYAQKIHKTWYAGRKLSGKAVRMHREIMEAKAGEQVDHRDGNGLNNQRYNLRLATYGQNRINRGRGKNNTSGYKGVYWRRERNKWVAEIVINGQRVHLGHFEDKIEAAKAYDLAALNYHGEFAHLNFTRRSAS